MTARRPRRVARSVAALALATAAPLTVTPTALAAPPQRVGWWNTLSAGSAVAPAPTTPPGGIHVAAGAGQVMAYGAVLYAMPADATAQLKLALTDTQGTPQLQACPTKNTRWKAGDDQPSDTAPAYNCDLVHYAGTVSADGATVTFTVTTFDRAAAGPVSLAIVPDLSGADSPVSGVNPPFSVDIGKPDSRSLTITSAAPPSSSAPGSTAPAARESALPPTGAVAAGKPLGVPLSANPPATQTVAPTATAPQVAATAPAAPTAPAAARWSGAPAATAGSVVGALALVAALLYWGLGRGLLGGRILPLSMPLVSPDGAARHRPSMPAD